jgi:hypothetical protein
MCVICSEELKGKLSELEQLRAYEELLFTDPEVDIFRKKDGVHILEKMLELKKKIYGNQESI